MHCCVALELAGTVSLSSISLFSLHLALSNASTFYFLAMKLTTRVIVFRYLGFFFSTQVPPLSSTQSAAFVGIFFLSGS